MPWRHLAAFEHFYNNLPDVGSSLQAIQVHSLGLDDQKLLEAFDQPADNSNAIYATFSPTLEPTSRSACDACSHRSAPHAQATFDSRALAHAQANFGMFPPVYGMGASQQPTSSIHSDCWPSNTISLANTQEECSPSMLPTSYFPTPDLEDWSELPCSGLPSLGSGGPRIEDYVDPLSSPLSSPSLPTPCSSTSSTKVVPSAAVAKQVKSQRKKAHTVVERKYRGNIADKMEQLDQALEHSSGVASDSKKRKIDILNAATNHVQHSDTQRDRMVDEIKFLRDRIRALEKLVNCSDCTLLNQVVSLQVQATTDVLA